MNNDILLFKFDCNDEFKNQFEKNGEVCLKRPKHCISFQKDVYKMLNHEKKCYSNCIVLNTIKVKIFEINSIHYNNKVIVILH